MQRHTDVPSDHKPKLSNPGLLDFYRLLEISIRRSYEVTSLAFTVCCYQPADLHNQWVAYLV